ncbi:uncharacterized protein LOC127875198 [Dreissena polymorpha]|nr:uncharacterized protein LOC127875198 [Dreissena polymorpha]
MNAVAYAEPEHLKKCFNALFPDNDFEIIEAIGRKCGARWGIDFEECFAYVAISKKSETIIVSYRGTSGNKLQQALHIFQQMSSYTIEVNSYFNSTFKRLYDPCIRDSVKQLAKDFKNYEVVVTGYSLGGALASLTAYALVKEGVVAKDRLTLYTFGSPRVGGKRYSIDHDETVPNSWRIINWHDIAPMLPLEIAGYYHHKTAVLYIDNIFPDLGYIVCTDEEKDVRCQLPVPWPSLDQHTTYFGINLGSFCQTKLKYKRATKESTFPDDHCEVISLKDDDKISNTIIKNVTESACDFEQNNCDWMKSIERTFAFKRKKGPSDDDKAGVTGPESDSTGSGYYIYAEASGNMEQLAKLRSPNFFPGRYCFEFFYHMYGEDMGSLTLTMNSVPFSLWYWSNVFKVSGNQGKDWKSVRIDVDGSPIIEWRNFMIYFEFEARIGKSYRSDIAIDSIHITPTKC